MEGCLGGRKKGRAGMGWVSGKRGRCVWGGERVRECGEFLIGGLLETVLWREDGGCVWRVRGRECGEFLIGGLWGKVLCVACEDEGCCVWMLREEFRGC